MLLGNAYYRGSVPDDPSCRCFFGTLDSEIPSEVILAPIYLNDRLVAVFYADSGDGETIEAETEHCLRLVRKLSLALSMLLLKMKIRSA